MIGIPKCCLAVVVALISSRTLHMKRHNNYGPRSTILVMHATSEGKKHFLYLHAIKQKMPTVDGKMCMKTPSGSLFRIQGFTPRSLDRRGSILPHRRQGFIPRSLDRRGYNPPHRTQGVTPHSLDRRGFKLPHHNQRYTTRSARVKIVTCWMHTTF